MKDLLSWEKDYSQLLEKPNFNGNAEFMAYLEEIRGRINAILLCLNAATENVAEKEGSENVLA